MSKPYEDSGRLSVLRQSYNSIDRQHSASKAIIKELREVIEDKNKEIEFLRNIIKNA